MEFSLSQKKNLSFMALKLRGKIKEKFPRISAFRLYGFLKKIEIRLLRSCEASEENQGIYDKKIIFQNLF